MLSGAIDAFSMIGMPSHREIAESMMDATV
jgi:hypothetical protein